MLTDLKAFKKKIIKNFAAHLHPYHCRARKIFFNFWFPLIQILRKLSSIKKKKYYQKLCFRVSAFPYRWRNNIYDCSFMLLQHKIEQDFSGAFSIHKIKITLIFRSLENAKQVDFICKRRFVSDCSTSQINAKPRMEK